MDKSSLGHPDTTPVKSQSHGSIELSTISSLTPYIEPQSGDDYDPRLIKTVACADVPEKCRCSLDSDVVKSALKLQ